MGIQFHQNIVVPMSVGSLGLIASQNGIHFKKYAEKLLDSGAVYRCFCSNEEFEQMK
ncbi:Glutamate--tRNA ligase chloroplastic/mitochondrial [Zea mays]|uniref:Glutamate--tRNA ligase chloroplastic/mitochondrial n=1 Tax=Zea mays TaxID=4577 RepID=A0A1D6GEP7_MAIZE|nr:Glutamate--tRNA ligase chloroplastic/mitochondrial [Zea mays]